MVTHVITTSPAKQFAEYDADWEAQHRLQEALFGIQSSETQRMLEVQSRLISKALEHHQAPLHLVLPGRVQCRVGAASQSLVVPPDLRDQKIGGLLDSLEITDLDRRLAELEASSDPSVSTSARLMRHAIARHLVHAMPAGGSGTQAANWTGAGTSAYAQRFFCPQWVALDDHDNLLVNSLQEAEADMVVMQHYLSVMASAASLAPYIVADKEYQRKRDGMYKQLVHQGCALARHRTGEMIDTIKRRAASGSLNRGLSLSLPYFDYESLQVLFWEFQVIPRGRVQFAPAFVVVAARMEQIKLEHEPEISPSTRRNILQGLKALESAFDPNGGTSRR